ncbi:hypothetical protein AB6A40_002221 [Gnathostoma spinigerum]|uniref:Uncharacterized protein n=1 Tax=Gnathostoma spinigerum TaxID=75299 RepID=A0ABD6EFR0_9BILA
MSISSAREGVEKLILADEIAVCADATVCKKSAGKNSALPLAIDAVCSVCNTLYLFHGEKVCLVKANGLVESKDVSVVFPDVAVPIYAAIHNTLNSETLIFGGDKVCRYGYDGLCFKVNSLTPLCETLSETPTGAMLSIKWGCQILFKDMKYCIFGNSWATEFEPREKFSEVLPPEPVVGVADFNGSSLIFTKNMVYAFDKQSDAVIGGGVAFSSFLK